MSTLIDALVASLPPQTVRCRMAVTGLARLPDGRWQVRTAGEGAATWESDGVVIATPAASAAKLLEPVEPSLAAELSQMEVARCALVSLAYRRDQIAHPLDGFGVVVPNCEKRNVLSVSFSSVKYAGRAPDGFVLLRSYLGGALRADLVTRSDQELCDLAAADLQQFLGIRGAPALTMVTRPAGMPQYYLGHLARVERVEQQLTLLPGLALAGNPYRGVGIPQCIRSSELAVDRILARGLLIKGV